MASVYDIPADVLIKRASEEFIQQGTIVKPAWAHFVKTSSARERLPTDPNWWYIRAASLLRKMYLMNKPIGTNKLRKLYGGRKNRGHKPERYFHGSGKIIRVLLQQLEAQGYVQSVEKGVHKGRIITAKGRKFLDGLAKHE